MTNAEFSKSEDFIARCDEAGIKPTKRQASKWQHKKGKAYKLAHGGQSDSTEPRS